MPYACQVVWSIDKENGLYDTFIGCVVSALESVPPSLELYQIPPKDYVAFDFTGTASEKLAFVRSVFYDWFPGSGHENLDEGFSLIQFHKTSPDYMGTNSPEHKRIFSWEIWFPIQ